MHVIESIGPLLGIAAFLGLAILAFLLFQQSRDIRRLRQWAGRAPERAREAAEAVQAASEAAREEGAELEPPAGPPPDAPGRLREAWERASERTSSWLRGVDRRLPVDGRYLLAIATVAIAVAAVATSGFGLVGGNGGARRHKHEQARPRVAILNGTSAPGLADAVGRRVVEAAGYRTGVVTNTGSSFANTVVMYVPGDRAQAKRLTAAVRQKLGETPVQAMTPDVRSRADGAPLALALGLDESGFGGS